MNTQSRLYLSQVRELNLDPGRAAWIGGRAGELTVLAGRVWLTRDGDLADHVLERGARVNVGWAERAVVESWERDQSAMLQWRPVERRSASQALVAGALRGLAFFAAGVAGVLARAEGGFAALARSAASSARRAQGCITPGDSMASSGALK